jgi:predicted regulator of Ras-like GTPase activity (Roadblock/LC7/MglB family)
MNLDDVNFLLEDFVARVPNVTHIVALSVDGLLIARNEALPKDRADQLSAIASGLVSLLHGAARHLEAGRVVSNLTEMTGGFVFTMSVSSGALLTLAAPGCDIGQVGHELAELINRVGPSLRPQLRSDVLTPSGLSG